MSTNTTIRPGTDRPASTAAGPWVGDNKKTPSSRLRATGRRRSVPYLLLGVLLVLACVGGFVLISLHSDDREPVLALARGVPVGHVLAAQDLRQVNVAVDPGVAVVGADQAAVVIGRPMATSLSAGALLTPDAVGAAAAPAGGQAIAALALKPGQVPTEVGPGARVSVVAVSGQPGTASSPPDENATVWPAVVTSVTFPANEQTAVVSVQLTEAAARQIAAVPAGQVSIVMLSAGGGR
ncbi:putative membrane protein [Actinokineospora spheciospongiae]|uniref:Putative membrane protein n=1 Tax=Actinokineospora spheciospongiae TaxID=909613 RepID=W7IUC0_9PSEU|nr:SAF domain-containing protein [Actinokineospora spheciospongiae]EWC64530.1 putative membrane protein [Actinokineospora spheciospongiae]